MSWIKISDDDGGVFAEENDQNLKRAVSILELENEIAYLSGQIKEAENQLIEIPDKIDDKIKMAINKWNGDFVATDIEPFKTQLDYKQQLLNILKAL